MISLWPSEHTGTTWLPVGEGVGFLCGPVANEGKERKDRRARRHESQALGADTQREGGMFIDFSHTHIVKRNCGASL